LDLTKKQLFEIFNVIVELLVSLWRGAKMYARFCLFFLLIIIVSGCAVNPVTGKKEFVIVGERWELETGEKQYSPIRQSQGGDYVVDDELTDYVSQVGQRLAAVSDRDLPYEFRVLNSSVPNAWALPGGKISINRGLLTELKSESELAAVLSHEIVHSAAKHGAHGMTRGLFLQTAAIGVALATKDEDYAKWAQVGTSIGAQLINQKYGRDAERESDHYGMLYMSRAGYDPQGAVDLQQTFLSLHDNQKPNWLEGLFASHPPSQERLQNNLEMLASLPSGGERGEERYKAKTAHLIKTKPAYEDFDKARKALKDDDVELANSLAEQAIRLEPKESIFYCLLGDIEREKRNLPKALELYDRAIGLNPNFFYHYLQRGRTNEELDFHQKAQLDLERSVALLPTADAYYILGNLSRDAGEVTAAIDYYSKVVANKGELGRQAYGDLVELDLSNNPAKYIKILKTWQTDQGVIVAEISNPTPRGVADIELAVAYKDKKGNKGNLNVFLRDAIPAESKQLFDLGIAERLAEEKAIEYQLNLVAAEIAN
jgi:predicted Zn-dependent protease